MRWSPFVLLALVVGCESSDPASAPLDAASEVAAEAGGSCAPDEALAPAVEGKCPVGAGDYVPGTDDGWAACASDDGLYHPFGTSIGSLTRVASFETIARHLGFGTAKSPSAADFIAARAEYSTAEGLLSRVARREDEHYPKAAKACRDMTAEEVAANVDRCVGPAKLLPLINDAFEAGGRGVDPILNAGRIEAGLLWFFYVSTHKEATSCTEKAADCDSMYAKYTGGTPRSEGHGLSRYVRARAPLAHDRAWNGVLAVRCWRDLDHPDGIATDLALRDRAIEQLDRALLRGVSAIVRQRARVRSCGAAWETARILGRVLDRDATKREPTKAAILRTELAKTDPSAVDETALISALDAVFPCP